MKWISTHHVIDVCSYYPANPREITITIDDFIDGHFSDDWLTVTFTTLNIRSNFGRSTSSIL